MNKIARLRVGFGVLPLIFGFFFFACGNDDVENGKPVDTHPIGIAPPKKSSGIITGRVMLARNVYASQPKSISISKDTDICGFSKSDKSLLMRDGGIENTVVWIEGMPAGRSWPFHFPALDQKKCEFKPRLMFVGVGEEMTVLNNDGILHNLHTYSRINPALNIAQPKFKKEIKVKFEKPEIIKIGCDVHSWMSGVVVVADHIYYAATNSEGEFNFLQDVPAGKYMLRAWHEKLGELSQEVLVESGKTTEIIFEYTKIP
ncbi:MAG: hypothetical protein HYT98_03230 [Candidatus Sungbacteria bacterium]|nr:hypothetical protein [Candidatus Sungbacteria bacterium]